MSQPEVRPCGDDLVLSLRDITKTYNTGELAVPVLKGISFDIYRGQFVGILGTSGSGKSTMLNILGMLDVPTGGEYTLEGIPVGSLADREQASIRNQKIGFVFQSFNLFNYLTIEQNIEVPMIYNRVPRKRRRERALELAKIVGLGHRLGHRPNQLSGGECQRVGQSGDQTCQTPKKKGGDQIDQKRGERVRERIEEKQAGYHKGKSDRRVCR